MQLRDRNTYRDSGFHSMEFLNKARKINCAYQIPTFFTWSVQKSSVRCQSVISNISKSMNLENGMYDVFCREGALAQFT